ncbi:hypothetical protein SELMODRAFT_411859 [Selaginella moellendorffii]|uniref:Uncharacterized protein n=1 Tax=Selaginella moellendorffii TaxID=88036 RepID=D8RJ93_SELML|nr:hypothetical protein SELMODRAFT_411859 [Selaginella moellendorffii]
MEVFKKEGFSGMGALGSPSDYFTDCNQKLIKFRMCAIPVDRESRATRFASAVKCMLQHPFKGAPMLVFCNDKDTAYEIKQVLDAKRVTMATVTLVEELSTLEKKRVKDKRAVVIVTKDVIDKNEEFLESIKQLAHCVCMTKLYERERTMQKFSDAYADFLFSPKA